MDRRARYMQGAGAAAWGECEGGRCAASELCRQRHLQRLAVSLRSSGSARTAGQRIARPPAGPQKVPSIDIPLHTVMELTPRADGTMAETRFIVDVDKAIADAAALAAAAGESQPAPARCHRQAAGLGTGWKPRSIATVVSALAAHACWAVPGASFALPCKS